MEEHDGNKCYKASQLLDYTFTNKSSRICGSMILSSERRICYINNKLRPLKYETNDLVVISNGRMYIKGRADRCAKINGKLIDLFQLESLLTIHFSNSIDSCYVVFNEYLIMFLYINKNSEINETSIRAYILRKFPSHFEPRYIHFFDLNEHRKPITSHGKKIKIHKI
jgi:acyl-coenzyme A synthetase/AMP-(fatty) acid ligase